jgi:hypothetical protein
MNRVYFNGGLFIPNTMIKGAIKGGITIAKMKMEKSSKRAIDLVKALLWINPEEIHLTRKGKKLGKSDLQMMDYWVKTDMGKIVWVRSAVLLLPWEGEFKITLHGDLEFGFIKQALENAGLMCSIGGRRPDFGKFEVK